MKEGTITDVLEEEAGGRMGEYGRHAADLRFGQCIGTPMYSNLISLGGERPPRLPRDAKAVSLLRIFLPSTLPGNKELLLRLLYRKSQISAKKSRVI